MKTDRETRQTTLSGYDAPQDRTGPTPEEIAYQPHMEERYLPRYIFRLAVILLLAAFAGGGFFYFHFTIQPEKNYQTATRFFQNGDYAKALMLYRKVLKTRPERKDTVFQIALCLEKLNDIPGAIEAYSAHIKNQPDDSKALTCLGNLYMEIQQPTDAIPFYKKAIRFKKNSAKLYFSLASAYRQQGEPEAASKYYIQVIALEKQNLDRVITASKFLMTCEHYREALKGYQKAAGINSSDMRGLHGAQAARAMLGLPVDDRQRITPQKSLGSILLRSPFDAIPAGLNPVIAASSRDIGGNTYRIITYALPPTSYHLTLYINPEGYIEQIETDSPHYLTEEGVGLSNFQLSKYATLFVKKPDIQSASIKGTLYLYHQNGLSFFLPLSGDSKPFLRVHPGERPLEIKDTRPPG